MRVEQGGDIDTEASAETLRRAPRMLFFRAAGTVGCAVLALLLPEVGPNRVLVAALLAFVAAPLAIFIRLRFSIVDNGWVEPLYDLLLVVSLVHLVPDVWFPALCVGLMVALAPSIGLHPRSYFCYAALLLILLGGMSFAALQHQVDGWGLPLLSVAVVYPSLVYYSHMQTSRAVALRARAQRVDSLRQIAGSLAHDFNNILAGISGHAELAALDVPPQSGARTAIGEVLNGTRRASLLCRQLLSFSGRDLRTQQLLDLREEVDTIVDLLRPTLPANAAISWQTAPDHLLVQGDQGQLQQVIMNVLVNAAEAAGEEGAQVAMALQRTTEGARELAVLEIADQGKGIDDEALASIFDPFFTTKARGHGLGLASAKRIMASLGGSIRVESELHHGTTVTLRLPVHAEPEAQAPIIVAERSPLPGGKILVVDDEEPVRAIAREFLDTLGLRAALAASADEAVATFAEEPDAFAAVLLDLRMPGKDGWQCLEELRALRPGLPAIICSGFDPKEGHARGRAGERVSYLSKPFRLDDLRAALADVTAEPSAEEKTRHSQTR